MTPSSPAASSRASASSRRARSARLERAVLGEVAALGDALAVDGGELRLERARVEDASDVPVAGRDEGAALALALDDEADGDRLDAAGGEPLHHLLPEHGRDLVAVEPVEDAPRLLRVDEPLVDLARLAERLLDRVARDLVEDHPAHGHLRLQHLEQVPGDRLALAVFIRREQELVGVLQQLLQLGDLALLVRVDDVERLELVLDVDAEPCPGLLLELLRDLRGAVREVANVADARFDHVVLAEIAGDGLRLRRALDDHQFLAMARDTLAAHWDTPCVSPRPSLMYLAIAGLSWPLLYGPVSAPRQGSRAPARRGRLRPGCEPQLELRPVAARADALPEALPALHGQVGALLHAVEADRRSPRARSRCAAGRPISRRWRRRRSSAAKGTSWSCSRRGPGARRGCARSTRRVPTPARRGSRSTRTCRSIPAGIVGTDRLGRLAQLRVAYGPPIPLDDLAGREDAPQVATERLMAAIDELERSA